MCSASSRESDYRPGDEKRVNRCKTGGDTCAPCIQLGHPSLISSMVQMTTNSFVKDKQYEFYDFCPNVVLVEFIRFVVQLVSKDIFPGEAGLNSIDCNVKMSSV